MVKHKQRYEAYANKDLLSALFVIALFCTFISFSNLHAAKTHPLHRPSVPDTTKPRK
jgi:hypothetical protein